MAPIRLRSIGVSVYRVPIETPVRMSFGVLRDRAAVIVRAIDDHGCEGWGRDLVQLPLAGEPLLVRGGAMALPDSAGLGATPDVSALTPYLTLERTIDSKQISGGPLT